MPSYHVLRQQYAHGPGVLTDEGQTFDALNLAAFHRPPDFKKLLSRQDSSLYDWVHSNFYPRLLHGLLHQLTEQPLTFPIVVVRLQQLLSHARLSKALVQTNRFDYQAAYDALFNALFEQASRYPQWAQLPGWQRLLSSLPKNPVVFGALETTLQYRILANDWPRLPQPKDWLSRSSLLKQAYQHLMQPLYDSALRVAKDWNRCLLGGPTSKRLEQKAKALYEQDFLAVYRWSGAMLRLLMTTDAKQYREGYEALLCLWLADGGQHSLGEALRDTPWFSGREVYSDEDWASRVLRFNKNDLPILNRSLSQLPVHELPTAAKLWDARAVMGSQRYLQPLAEQLIAGLGAIITATRAQYLCWYSKEAPEATKQQARALEDQCEKLIRRIEEAALVDSRLVFKKFADDFRWLLKQAEWLMLEVPIHDYQRLLAEGTEAYSKMLRDELIRSSEKMVTASMMVESDQFQLKPGTAEHFLEGLGVAASFLGGVHKFLAGTAMLAGMEAAEHVLHTMESMDGALELMLAGNELFGLSLRSRFERWYEEKTGDLSVKTQMRNVYNAFDVLSKKNRQIEVLVDRLLQVYADPMARLTEASQLQLGQYLICFSLVYIQYGFLSVKPSEADDYRSFVNELLGWLAFADYAHLQQGGGMRPLVLERKIGGQVTAAELFSQSGLVCIDNEDNPFRFYYGRQIPGSFGYRLALESEVTALNQQICRGYAPDPIFQYGDDLSR